MESNSYDILYKISIFHFGDIVMKLLDYGYIRRTNFKLSIWFAKGHFEVPPIPGLFWLQT